MDKELVIKNAGPVVLENSDKIIINGLQEALFAPMEFSAQISQPTTIFKNMRWYLISNLRQMLSEAYTEIGLIQTICDVPVRDALRGGVDISTSMLDEKEITALIHEIEEENDMGKYAQACIWNRLFGGAGVIVITDQDPTTELDIDAITEDSPLEFRAVDMWELFFNKQNTEDRYLEVTPDETTSPDVDYFDYYGHKIHKSRVVVLKGIEAPSFVRPRLRGWGISVCETLVQSVNQYLKSTELTFEVLDEFKLDIFKIKNLANMVQSPHGEAVIKRRVALANAQKNFQNAITMDAEDDYVQKQLSFAGLAEAMEGIRMQVAADLRMPLTKIFGISSAGFNSGEDDIENYNAMVESSIRTPAKFDIIKLIKIRAKKKFGVLLEDLSITFKPLRVLSSTQEEEVKNSKFNRLLQARQAGEITTKEFREAVNKEKLLPLQLDTSIDTLTIREPKEIQDKVGTAVKAPASKITTKPAKEADA